MKPELSPPQTARTPLFCPLIKASLWLESQTRQTSCHRLHTFEACLEFHEGKTTAFTGPPSQLSGFRSLAVNGMRFQEASAAQEGIVLQCPAILN